MKKLLVFFSLILLLNAKEIINLHKYNNFEEIKINHIPLLIVDNNNGILIMSIKYNKIKFNENTMSRHEKLFQLFIDITEKLFINADFSSNKQIILSFFYDNQILDFGLLINKNNLKLQANRTYSTQDLGLMNKIPLLPLKILFKNSYIVNLKLINHKFKIINNPNITKEFHKYLDKHMWNNSMIEFALEDKYNEYLKLKNTDKIHDCVILNDIKCIKQYITYNLDINKLDKKNQQTPLSYAVVNNNIKVVKLLLNNGANANIFPNGFLSPYFHAKKKSFTKIAKLLKPYTKVTTQIAYTNSNRICGQISNTSFRALCYKGQIQVNECYGLENTTLQQICTKGKGYCNNLDDVSLRMVCNNGKSYCSSIDNKELRHSCQSYQGNMLFWTIMASGGYILKTH